MNDDLFGAAEPAPRKLTDKQRRRQAPEPRQRGPRVDLSADTKAIRILDEWRMLSPEAQKEHADVLGTAIPDTTREEFNRWRREHGTQ